MIKESDWKKFKVIKERALDRYCAAALSDFEEIIQKEDMSNHDRYLTLFKMVQDKDKRLSQIFDGHSRSKAVWQLALMRSAGLVEAHELEGMSDELLTTTEPR